MAADRLKFSYSNIMSDNPYSPLRKQNEINYIFSDSTQWRILFICDSLFISSFHQVRIINS